MNNKEVLTTKKSIYQIIKDKISHNHTKHHWHLVQIWRWLKYKKSHLLKCKMRSVHYRIK
jgi:hypothetical protein